MQNQGGFEWGEQPVRQQFEVALDSCRTQQGEYVCVVDHVRRSGVPHLGRVLRRAHDLALHLDQSQAGMAESDEAIDRLGARSERRGTEQECMLQFSLGVIEKRLHQTRPTAETSEHCALADPGLGGETVHGDRVHPDRRHQFGRCVQEAAPVASGVAALGLLARDRKHEVGHLAHCTRLGNKVDRGPVQWYELIEHRLTRTRRNIAMSESHVLVLVGSLRADSVNKQIAQTASELAPEGSSVVVYDGLADIPFYNEDIDVDGQVPAAALDLRAAAEKATAFLLVTPEYNGTIPAVLKNAIDWLSRPYGAGAVQSKPVAVISASPSGNGAKWAHDDARKAVGIAGGKVLEDVTLTIGGTIDKFGSAHPRENTEVSAEIAGVIAELVKASDQLVAA